MALSRYFGVSFIFISFHHCLPKSYLSLPSFIGCFLSLLLSSWALTSKKNFVLLSVGPQSTWAYSRKRRCRALLSACAGLYTQLRVTLEPHAKKFPWVLPCRSAAVSAATGDWKETGCSVGLKVTMGKGKGIPSSGTLVPFGEVASCMFWFWVMQNRGVFISAVWWMYIYICTYIYNLKKENWFRTKKSSLHPGSTWKCAQTLALGAWEVKRRRENVKLNDK